MSNPNEKLAEVIMHPALMNVQVFCNHCQIEGSITTYKHYVKSIVNARFWCERCKSVNPDSVNIDMQHCPELMNSPFIPLRIIKWEIAITSSK